MFIQDGLGLAQAARRKRGGERPPMALRVQTGGFRVLVFMVAGSSGWEREWGEGMGRGGPGAGGSAELHAVLRSTAWPVTRRRCIKGQGVGQGQRARGEILTSARRRWRRSPAVQARSRSPPPKVVVQRRLNWLSRVGCTTCTRPSFRLGAMRYLGPCSPVLNPHRPQRGSGVVISRRGCRSSGCPVPARHVHPLSLGGLCSRLAQDACWEQVAALAQFDEDGAAGKPRGPPRPRRRHGRRSGRHRPARGPQRPQPTKPDRATRLAGIRSAPMGRRCNTIPPPLPDGSQPTWQLAAPPRRGEGPQACVPAFRPVCPASARATRPGGHDPDGPRESMPHGC